METHSFIPFISPEKVLLINELSRQQFRAPQQILDEALDHYLAAESSLREGIRAALREVEAGQTISADDVFAEFLSDPS